jgi:hypothetical protein
MPSILYSTTCYIKTALYRLRIYIDNQNEKSDGITYDRHPPSSDSLDFTATDIPLAHIQPSLTRLHFQLLDEKKISTNIPETITLNHLLHVKQTTSLSKKSNQRLSQTLRTGSSYSSERQSEVKTLSSLEQSQESNGSEAKLKRDQFSFRRFLSSFSNQDNEVILLSKTSIKLDYVDVSNSIRWNIKSLELELDTEDLANELYANLNLCLSTLTQRPRRLLAFVNPLSGKGMNWLFKELMHTSLAFFAHL